MAAVRAGIVQKCLAEFIGTYLLVFVVGCNVLGGNTHWGGVSIACVLMVSIYALGGISGANFNPAVSVALGLVQQFGGSGLDWKTVAMYSVVQIIAGVLGGYSYLWLHGEAFQLTPVNGWAGRGPAALVEIIYTFMLCFVVLNVAVSKGIGGKNTFYGLAIAFVIVAGAYGGGALSGGCFNPAVAFGLDVASAYLGFGWCFLYTLWELIGSGMAVAFFYFVRPGDFGKSGEKGIRAKLVCEFLGTFMLVFTVGLNVCAGSSAAAFSIAASLMCMIYALGDISGAHFNPAVTVAITLSQDEFGWSDALGYIFMQLLGGAVAAGSYSGIACSFNLGPVAPYTWAGASVAEFVFTFLLCYVVLCVACSKTPNKEFFGLAIGSCVTVGGFAIGGISGGSLNPAVSCSIAIVSPRERMKAPEAIGYSIVELIGAAVAAGAYLITHTTPIDDEDDEPGKYDKEG